MSFEDILAVVEAPIGIITFNRPNVLNALRSRLLREVSEALRAMENDEAVRAIVVTGAGEKAFAAGADISELNALATAGSGAEQARSGQALTRQIERLRKPVIMAINGFALGGGCEIAMAGDILIAAENAKFGQPEVNLGLIPGYGGSQRTTRLAGKAMASYLCLTGEMIDAREALRIGLVARVVPLSELMMKRSGSRTSSPRRRRSPSPRASASSTTARIWPSTTRSSSRRSSSGRWWIPRISAKAPARFWKSESRSGRAVKEPSCFSGAQP